MILASPLSRSQTCPTVSLVVDDVVPYLIVADAAAALSFYVSGLGAVEDHRLTMPDGKIGHAEVRLVTAACMWL